jgi:hypothetical protein
MGAKSATLAGVFLVIFASMTAVSPVTDSQAVAASIKPCQGENLIGATASSSVYAGGAIIVLAITNIGTSNCQLGGYPRLLGIREGHEYKITHLEEGPTQDGQLRATVLSPRVAGALIFDTPLGCNANVYPPPVASDYTGVVVLLPNQQGHVKVLGVPLSIPCGLEESRLGWSKGFELDQS